MCQCLWILSALSTAHYGQHCRMNCHAELYGYMYKHWNLSLWVNSGLRLWCVIHQSIVFPPPLLSLLSQWRWTCWTLPSSLDDVGRWGQTAKSFVFFMFWVYPEWVLVQLLLNHFFVVVFFFLGVHVLFGVKVLTSWFMFFWTVWGFCLCVLLESWIYRSVLISLSHIWWIPPPPAPPQYYTLRLSTSPHLMKRLWKWIVVRTAQISEFFHPVSF